MSRIHITTSTRIKGGAGWRKNMLCCSRFQGREAKQNQCQIQRCLTTINLPVCLWQRRGRCRYRLPYAKQLPFCLVWRAADLVDLPFRRSHLQLIRMNIGCTHFVILKGSYSHKTENWAFSRQGCRFNVAGTRDNNSLRVLPQIGRNFFFFLNTHNSLLCFMGCLIYGCRLSISPQIF